MSRTTQKISGLLLPPCLKGHDAMSPEIPKAEEKNCVQESEHEAPWLTEEMQGTQSKAEGEGGNSVLWTSELGWRPKSDCEVDPKIKLFERVISNKKNLHNNHTPLFTGIPKKQQSTDGCEHFGCHFALISEANYVPQMTLTEVWLPTRAALSWPEMSSVSHPIQACTYFPRVKQTVSSISVPLKFYLWFFGSAVSGC